MLEWNDPISFIHGLSAQQRRVLKVMEAEKVSDLLQMFPRRYDDYSKLVPLAAVKNDEPVTVKVTIKEIKQAPTFRRRFALIRALVWDASGSITVTWFNQPWLLKQLHAGDEIFLSGSVTQRPRFGRGFTSPLWEPVSAETLAAGMVAPVYPLTGSVSQKTLRAVMKALIDDVHFPSEYVPSDMIDAHHLLSLDQAYRWIHRPETTEQAEQARRRFAFDELFIYQLAMRTARKQADTAGAPAVTFDQPFVQRLVHDLPFELTVDQKKALWVIIQDLEKPQPMRRLLQGDVGSGKTVIACLAAASAFRASSSAALLAPTELLAKQHFATFVRLLSPHQIPVLLMTSSARRLSEGGSESSLTPNEARERIAQGRVIVIGTHALLERGQSPPDLALAVVDEQHRFGVAQRETLTVSSRPDGQVPHLLSMSATPIPRSLALTLLGDLDVSVIKTKPVGRQPVKTTISVGLTGREQAYAHLKREVEQGHRGFIVCPLIDPSDFLGARSVEQEARRLKTGPLQSLRLSILHGGLSSADKDRVMDEFVKGECDVLIATTVVEVGVDVPEATVILIESPERFGLAQLHQLRGRVGRSSHPSHCFLMMDEESSSFDRLRILEQTNDGFEIAEADLRHRGAGNLLGREQSGIPLFRLARTDDLDVMKMAQASAEVLMREDPELTGATLLRQKVEELRQTSHRE